MHAPKYLTACVQASAFANAPRYAYYQYPHPTGIIAIVAFALENALFYCPFSWYRSAEIVQRTAFARERSRNQCAFAIDEEAFIHQFPHKRLECIIIYVVTTMGALEFIQETMGFARRDAAVGT